MKKMYSCGYFDVRPPSQLILEGPASHAEAWREWFTQFQMFLKASGVIRGGSDVKSSLLLELIGPKGYDIFSTFVFDKDDDSRDFDKVVKKFEEYFRTTGHHRGHRGQRDSTIPRYNFFTRNQEKGESIDDYVTVLRFWAEQCQFEHLEDGLIKDRIVCGVWDDSLRDVLLGTEILTLEEAMKICRAHENPQIQAKGLEEDAACGLDVLENTYDTYNSHVSQTAQQRRKRTALGHNLSYPM